MTEQTAKPALTTKQEFPTPADQTRLNEYNYYQRIFDGNHFDAFNIKIDNRQYGKEYSKIKYLVCNFGALVSKVAADMLFSEAPKITVEGGDQDWVDAFIKENHLDVLNYENALSNSALGDALYKLRIGKRQADDEEMTIIVDDTSPTIYFPVYSSGSYNVLPDRIELCWTFKNEGVTYLQKEIHYIGRIENKLYRMKDKTIEVEEPLTLLGNNAPEPVVETKVDFFLVLHVPNWKTHSSPFGRSDYQDITTLIYGLNNRLSKIDNILDKHSDPILAIPEGILDETGKVKKQALHMFEVPKGSNEKPEYVVWNASLENAFKEIEKMVEFLFMFSETSPDVLGMGQGQSDSGRALKLKLMRTIAKIARKRLYYDQVLKDLIYRAQVLGKEHGIKFNDKALAKEPIEPDIEWFDGLPIDALEQVELEQMKIGAGLTTQQDAIMRVEGVDEQTAEKKVAEINESKKLKMAEMGFTNVNRNVNNGGDNGEDDKKPTPPADKGE